MPSLAIFVFFYILPAFLALVLYAITTNNVHRPRWRRWRLWLCILAPIVNVFFALVMLSELIRDETV